jgi:purine-binding chemotaxis protein CheW
MKSASVSHALEKTVDTVKVKERTGKVDVVVQEYMDNLLGDLFLSTDTEVETIPDKASAITPEVEAVNKIASVPDNTTTAPLAVVTALKTESKPEAVVAAALVESPASPAPVAAEPQVKTYAKVIPHVSMPDESTLPIMEKTQPIKEVTAVKPQAQKHIPTIKPNPIRESTLKADVTLPTVEVPLPSAEESEPIEVIEKRFPKAPSWAQESFEVLLFDVCGLKLAVPMESLGRIIKVEHETNHLIGRPSWFMGAYNEAEEHLYVVDTAKYIMPEKGYDLELDGFEYLIQLQKSKWTLACKNVHTTVRLEPDQVKWRSSEGKRQWLSGTVIEHMCALIHVDKLVELLKADS